LLGDIPGKLFNILGQRVTFTQVDFHDYTTIVGRGWVNFNDEPGRGLVVENVDGRPQPLEFHTAVPGGDPEGDTYRDLAQRMSKAWETLVEQTPALADKRAQPIEILAEEIDLKKIMIPLGKGKDPISVPLGINDIDRKPTVIELQEKGPHWLVVGPPMTGKTTTLRSLVLALANSYSPNQVAMILVDPSDPGRQFYNFGSGDGNSLENLPHVLAIVNNAAELDEVVKRLHAEYTEPVREILKGQSNGYSPQNNKTRSIFVIFDHYDDADLLSSSGLGTVGLSDVGKGQNLHFVIGGSLDIMRDSTNKLRRRAESSRYTLVLQDYEAARYMGVRGTFTVKKELPPGRGFLVKAVTASLTQICLPFVDGVDGRSPDEQLAGIISEIRKKYRKSAQWSYQAKDLSVLEAAISAATDGTDGSSSSTTVSMSAEAGDAMAELEKLLAEQESSVTEEIPEAGDFASVDVQVEDDKAKASAKRSRGTKTAKRTPKKKA
jgi:hypothetical protein